MARLVLFNKPFGVLSQFTPDARHPCLAEYIDQPRVYPAGRLDRDSEGLLLLTDNGKLQQRLSNPKYDRWDQMSLSFIFHQSMSYILLITGSFSSSDC